MRVRFLPAALAAALAVCLAFASADAAKLVKSDLQFLREAAGAGKAEVTLGNLAVERAKSPEVRQFAQRMVEDHSRANDQLMDLAKSKKAKVSATVPSEAKSVYERLGQLSGDDFDRAYIKDMVNDHENAFSKFQDAAQNAKNPDVKQFAANLVPTLQDHLKQARQIESSLMNVSSTQPKAPSEAPASTAPSPEEQTQPSTGGQVQQPTPGTGETTQTAP